MIPNENKPITIFIVDDHAVVRRGAKAFLDAQPDFEVVGDVGSGGEAILRIGEFTPDVILMDLVMPGVDGIAATRHIKQKSPHTQIIVLTSYSSDEYIFPALKAGALSYLLKDIALADLADAVRKAAHGEAVMHPHVAARLVKEINIKTTAVLAYPHKAQFASLSEREREVLRLIAEGYSNNDIARQLVIAEKTVKSHVGNILSKLHIEDRTQAAVLAWREGFMH